MSRPSLLVLGVHAVEHPVGQEFHVPHDDLLNSVPRHRCEYDLVVGCPIGKQSVRAPRPLFIETIWLNHAATG